MRFLIEVNTTKGWKAISGAMVFGDAVQQLEASAFPQVMLKDTVTGQTWLYDDLDLDSAETDQFTELTITEFLDGGEFINHMAQAA